MARLVGDKKRDTGWLVVFVAEEDNGSTLDDAGQALETGCRQNLQWHYRDTPSPEITE